MSWVKGDVPVKQVSYHNIWGVDAQILVMWLCGIVYPETLWQIPWDLTVLREEARGESVIGGHLGVGGGSDCSCQMSRLSPPPPDRGVSSMCGLLLLWLQQKPQHIVRAESCAVHASLKLCQTNLMPRRLGFFCCCDFPLQLPLAVFTYSGLVLLQKRP